jgi:hypothetical protein
MRKIEKATPVADAIAPEEPPGSGLLGAGSVGASMLRADGAPVRLVWPWAPAFSSFRKCRGPVTSEAALVIESASAFPEACEAESEEDESYMSCAAAPGRRGSGGLLARAPKEGGRLDVVAATPAELGPATARPVRAGSPFTPRATPASMKVVLRSVVVPSAAAGTTPLIDAAGVAVLTTGPTVFTTCAAVLTTGATVSATGVAALTTCAAVLTAGAAALTAGSATVFEMVVSVGAVAPRMVWVVALDTDAAVLLAPCAAAREGDVALFSAWLAVASTAVVTF